MAQPTFARNLHVLTLAIAGVLGLLLGSSAEAQAPAQNDAAIFEYAGDGLRMLVTEESETRTTYTVKGQLIINGQPFPFTASNHETDTAFKGQFYANDQSYDFTAVIDPNDENKITLKSGSATYNLVYVETDLPPAPVPNAPAGNVPGGDAWGNPPANNNAAENADALARGAEAYGQENYAEAQRIFQPLAERGHIGSAYAMGMIMDFGHLGEANHAEAVRYYRIAARAPHMGAYYNLGCLLRDGKGGPANVPEAAQLFEAAAYMGNASAMRAYSALIFNNMIDKGSDGHKLAFAWMMAAANNGDQYARKNLQKLADNGSTAEDFKAADQYVNQTLLPEIEKRRGNGDLLMGFDYTVVPNKDGGVDIIQ